MNISTNLTKADLIKVNVLLAPRIKANYIFMAVIFALFILLLCWRKGFPHSTETWLVYVAVAGLAAVLSIVFGVLINILMIIFTVKAYAQSGVLGQHDFIISQDGVHEKTAVNETLHKWQGIRSVSVAGGYLLVMIEGSQLHILPKRSFLSSADFEKCVAMMKGYQRNDSPALK